MNKKLLSIKMDFSRFAITVNASSLNFIGLAIILFSLQLPVFGQISRQWVNTYNGQGDFNDHFNCVKVDAGGNVYAGGSTVNPDNERDYLIVKYSSSGTVLWNKQFAGNAGGSDEITAMAISDSGYIYVTGFLKQSVSGTDYFTVKLNANGDTLWTAAYNNPAAFGFDQANDVFVDADGNVYVTGQSDSDPTSLINDDYLTVKYSAGGIFLWEKRYNGSGNAIDRPVKVMADASGNVVVTGRSDNGSNDDYVTIKYNSSGVQQWLISGNRGGRDRAASMAMDASGNIYVTGRSSNGGNDDFWTLKYNAAGTLLWQKPYDYLDNDRALDIAVDSNGNVFVTGQSDADLSTNTNWDYETVMYNSTGTQVWQNRFNGSSSQNDIPSSLSFSNGQVYVSGISDVDASVNTAYNIITIAYSAASGSQSWLANYNGSANANDTAVAVTATANGCFVAGDTYGSGNFTNALLISYSFSGSQQWEQSFNGVGNNNENIRSITVDNSSNVYATGYSVGNKTDRNMAYWRFNTGGSLVCTYLLDGSVSASTDDGIGIALNSNGNPFIAGYLENSGQSNDVFYLNMNSAICDTVWTRTYNSTSNGSDRTYDLVKDQSGNFYITGRIDMDPTFNSNPDCFTAKINSSGTILWLRTYNSSGTNEDRGSFVRVAPSGNVYIIGRTWNGTDYDLLLISYDNAGTLRWVKTYSGAVGIDQPSGAVLDANENVYVTGRTEVVVPEIYDYLTLKYNSSGTLIWNKIFNGSGNGNDEAQAIAFNPLHNGPVITGKSDVDPSAVENMDMITIQYDGNGDTVWTHSYSGSAGTDDIPDDIAVNSNNQVYYTGHFNTSSLLYPNYNLYVGVLDAGAGATLWEDTYNGSSDSSDIPNLIYLNGNEFFIAGSTFETGQQRNILVLKYSGTVDNVAEIRQNNEIVIFPNPASDAITFRLKDSTHKNMMLTISDMTGRIVLSEEWTALPEKSIKLDLLSAGMYHFVVESNGKQIGKGKFAHTNAH